MSRIYTGGGTPRLQSTQIWRKETNASRLNFTSLSLEAIGGGTRNSILPQRSPRRRSETGIGGNFYG